MQNVHVSLCGDMQACVNASYACMSMPAFVCVVLRACHPHERVCTCVRARACLVVHVCPCCFCACRARERACVPCCFCACRARTVAWLSMRRCGHPKPDRPRVGLRQLAPLCVRCADAKRHAAAPLSAAHRGMRGCRSVMGGAVAHGDVVVRTIDEKLIAIFVRSH